MTARFSVRFTLSVNSVVCELMSHLGGNTHKQIGTFVVNRGPESRVRGGFKPAGRGGGPTHRGPGADERDA